VVPWGLRDLFLSLLCLTILLDHVTHVAVSQGAIPQERQFAYEIQAIRKSKKVKPTI